MLSGCNLAYGWRQAERLREAIAGTLFHLDGGPLAVTCSFGLASTEHTAPARLICEADEALYRAKDQGRDRVAAREGGLLRVNYSLVE